jgi:small subunit ribosomal protein S16
LEKLGTYDPLSDSDHALRLQRERIDYWLGVGAQPTNAVVRLLRRHDAQKPTP